MRFEIRSPRRQLYEVPSMTLTPDRTCRLKFPVVAEELIEYSGARHGECSLGGKTWKGKLSPPPMSESACPRTAKGRRGRWRRLFFYVGKFSSLWLSPTYYCSSLASLVPPHLPRNCRPSISPRLRRLEIIHKKSSLREYQSRSRKWLSEIL